MSVVIPIAEANETSSGNPDAWWGGMDRTPFQIKNEDSPKFVTESALNTVPDDYTGLVFVHEGVHEKRADLYEKGRKVCTVITFKNGKRTEYSREGKVMGEFYYYPSQQMFYKRFYPTKEQRESLDKEHTWYYYKKVSPKYVAIIVLVLLLCLYFTYGLTTIQLSIILPILCILLCIAFFALSKKCKRKEPYWLMCLVVASLLGYLLSNGTTICHVLLKHAFRIILVAESIALPNGSSISDASCFTLLMFLITLFLCV